MHPTLHKFFFTVKITMASSKYSHLHGFVKYLDELHAQTQLSYFDVMKLSRNIELYYQAAEEQLNLSPNGTQYTQTYPFPQIKPQTPPSPPILELPETPVIKTPPKSTSLFQKRKQKNHPPPIQREYVLFDASSTDQAYNRWKEQNETNIFVSSDDISCTPTINDFMPSKPLVEIDMDLYSTDDLLDLINKHPYDSSKQYNIDLKVLHSIRPELEELHNMVGLRSLKTSVLRQLLYFLQGFHKPHSSTSSSNNVIPYADYKHTILTGPPGTGKTEIAKILGNMYSKIGILKKNSFRKVTRSDLVGGYLGQTAMKTKTVVTESLGGVLFIDEAYSLQYDDSYAKECVDTLCECMSFHKDDLMVIIAGYEKELDESIFKINSGMRSRFIWRFALEPYDATDLYKIFCTKMNQQSWHTREKENVDWFHTNKPHFLYNGRDMEVLFTYVKISHAHRVYGKGKDAQYEITNEDLDRGLELLLQNRKDTDSHNRNTSIYAMYV
jgi:hypothetical protein